MRLIAISSVALLLLAARVEAEPLTIFGAPQEDILEVPNRSIDTRKPASFGVWIGPWHRIPGTTRESQIERILANPPADQTYAPAAPVKPIPVAEDMAMTMMVEMAADTPRSRQAIFFACDYKNKKEFYREIAISGRTLDFLAVGKKPVFELLLDHARGHCKERPSRAEAAAIRAAITAAPGEGDGADRLDRVAYSWSAGLGAGGLFEMREWTNLLFDDGWGRRGIDIPLTQFDVAASREIEPEDWYRWREDADGKVEIERTDDGTASWRSLGGSPTFIGPAAKGTRYSGRFEYWHTSGNAFTGASVRNEAYIFRKDGTYSSTSSRMSESIGGMGSTANSVRTEGPDGCASAVSIAGGVVGGGATSDPDCGDGRSGTYEIDGFVITLRANNGVTARFPFYARSDQQFIMHGRTFSYSKAVE